MRVARRVGASLPLGALGVCVACTSPAPQPFCGGIVYCSYLTETLPEASLQDAPSSDSPISDSASGDASPADAAITQAACCPPEPPAFFAVDPGSSAYTIPSVVTCTQSLAACQLTRDCTDIDAGTLFHFELKFTGSTVSGTADITGNRPCGDAGPQTCHYVVTGGGCSASVGDGGGGGADAGAGG